VLVKVIVRRISREEFVERFPDKVNPAFNNNTRMAMDRISRDQELDMGGALVEGFEGYGKGNTGNIGSSTPVGTQMQKVFEMVNEYGRLNQALKDAGVSPSKVQGLKRLDTGMLQQGIPGPYIETLPNQQELRVFTELTGKNPITKERELVPYLDPGTGKPLTHKYGRRARREGYEWQRADEETMEVVQKLRGLITAGRDHGGRALSDLVSVDPVKNTRSNVDVMMRPASVKSSIIPAFTSIVPTQVPRSASQDAKMREVETLLNQYTTQYGGNPIAAVDYLTSKDVGLLGVPKGEERVGKIMRSDINRVEGRNEQYDELIMPGFSREVFDRGTANTVTAAPTTIHGANLHQLREMVEQGLFNMEVKPNWGAKEDGPLRAQIRARVPLSNSAITDITQTDPITQQALALDAMNWSRKPKL
jgi:hypothetical protein